MAMRSITSELRIQIADDEYRYISCELPAKALTLTQPDHHVHAMVHLVTGYSGCHTDSIVSQLDHVHVMVHMAASNS